MSSQEKCLLLGFGDIAQRLSLCLSSGLGLGSGYDLTGVRRRAFTANTVNTVSADCRDLDQLSPIIAEGFDVIVITMTPDDISDVGYYRAYVQTTEVLLQALQDHKQSPRIIVFASSSSVYGQHQGEWVDEQSATQPNSFSGKRLLEAEHLLLNSHHTTCCVRFSGIYGPGRRRLIDQVLARHGAAQHPVSYSNRIHADDCAGVLAHVIEHQKHSPVDAIYLASDCQPTPLYEVKRWLAQQLQIPLGELEPKAVKRTLRSSKRCSSKKLLASGYSFLYPDYQAGYRTLLDETNL